MTTIYCRERKENWDFSDPSHSLHGFGNASRKHPSSIPSFVLVWSSQRPVFPKIRFLVTCLFDLLKFSLQGRYLNWQEKLTMKPSLENITNNVYKSRHGFDGQNCCFQRQFDRILTAKGDISYDTIPTYGYTNHIKEKTTGMGEGFLLLRDYFKKRRLRQIFGQKKRRKINNFSPRNLHFLYNVITLR